MTEENDDYTFQKSVVISLLFGGTAGCIAKTTIAPLDRAKINFQTSKRPFSSTNLLKFLKETVNEHGFRYLWRGNSATLMRVFPYAGIQYTANEVYKHILEVDMCEMKQNERFWCNKKLFLNFLSGSLAGVTAVLSTYPLDLSRARMAVTHKNQYRHLGHVMIRMSREEGFFSLYKGISPTLLGIVPYSGMGFLFYETIRDILGDENRKLSKPVSFVSGACAGIVAQFFSYPLDIVRRRMQTSSVQGKTDYSKFNVSTCLNIIKQKEGLMGGLYKGFTLNLIKTPTALAISFTVYHELCDTFDIKVSRR